MDVEKNWLTKINLCKLKYLMYKEAIIYGNIFS